MVWTVTVSPLIVTSKPGNKGLGAGWEERRLGQMLAQMDGCWDSGLDKPIKTPKPGKFEIGEGTSQKAAEKMHQLWY